MKKKILSIMLSLLMVASVIGCGSKDMETVSSENRDAENTEVVKTVEDSITKEVVESEIVEKIEDSAQSTYTEREYAYILDGSGNWGSQFDLNSLESNNQVYILEKSVDIYYTDTSYAGYTKENIEITMSSSNDEWCFCSVGTSGYLIKTDELMSAVAKEEEVEIVKEDTPSTNETVTDTSSVVETPTTEQPVEEQPVATSNKYTPEEAIAVYRSIMEAGGMIWNPSLKNGGSYGTGWIYLEKGMPEWAASSNLEAAKMGNGDGVAWNNYYLEVTGSDSDTVYITEWAD